jgi:hypothetical protein
MELQVMLFGEDFARSQGDVLKTLTKSTLDHREKIRMFGNHLSSALCRNRDTGARDAKAAGDVYAPMTTGKSDMTNETSSLRHALYPSLGSQLRR